MTIIFWLTLLCFALPAQPPAAAALAIGNSAPDFMLKDLHGKPHALKDHRGRLTVVAFIAARCNISNAYTERLRALTADYAARNVVFLGVNASGDESVTEMRVHAERSGFNFTILKDEGHVVADAYAAERTPKVFVIDAAGVLRYLGRIDNSRMVKRNDLREALDELLAGKAVSVAETKAFGCIIKRGPDTPTNQIAPPPNDERAAALQPASFAGFVNSFAPQRTKPIAKPAAKRPAATGPAITPNVKLLKPAAFNALLKQARGKVLVLNFWATWCGPCVAEFPEFVALDAKYRNQGVRLIGISADDVSDLKTKVVPFLKEQKARYQNFVQDTDDPQQMIDVIDKEWQGQLPTTFVFDKQGKAVYKRYGIINREQLVAAIEKAMK